MFDLTGLCVMGADRNMFFVKSPADDDPTAWRALHWIDGGAEKPEEAEFVFAQAVRERTRFQLQDTLLYLPNADVPAPVRAAEPLNLVSVQSLHDLYDAPARAPPPGQKRLTALIYIQCHGAIPTSERLMRMPAETTLTTQMLVGNIGSPTLSRFIHYRALWDHCVAQHAPLVDADAFDRAVAAFANYTHEHFVAKDKHFTRQEHGHAEHRWFRRSTSTEFVDKIYNVDAPPNEYTFPRAFSSIVLCVSGLLDAQGNVVIPAGTDITEHPGFLEFIRKTYPDDPAILRCPGLRPDLRKVSAFTSKDLYLWLYTMGCKYFHVVDDACSIIHDATDWKRAKTVTKRLGFTRSVNHRRFASVSPSASRSHDSYHPVIHDLPTQSRISRPKQHRIADHSSTQRRRKGGNKKRKSKRQH